MVEFEADDALGAAAARLAEHPDVERVVILSPDKDMAQCVREDGRVVTFDRRAGRFLDRDGVEREVRRPAGVDPRLPGARRRQRRRLPGPARLGRRSAAAVLARYPHLEDIPDSVGAWDLSLRGAASLALTLRERRDEALLYRELATLRTRRAHPAARARRAALARRGPAAFEALAVRLRAPRLLERLPWAAPGWHVPSWRSSGRPSRPPCPRTSRDLQRLVDVDCGSYTQGRRR